MAYWAKPEINRHQVQMFCPTLDSMISEDHPVRLYEEMLSALDWREWEARYHGRRGQPPIHPRILAGAILYGLNRRIRSSRQLEDACQNRLDYLWLVEGRQIDHSTFADFRVKFKTELKSTFKQVGRIAMRMGYIRLFEVATDGTQMQADSSRHETASAETIEKRLAQLEQELTQALEEWEATDGQENQLFGPGVSPSQLPAKLRKLQQRQEQLHQALEQIQAVEAARQANGGQRTEKEVKIPVSDPDSRVLPNKDGGWAPNYTPVATTDGHEGFIVDTDVVNDRAEAGVQTAGLDRIEQTFGQPPDTAMGDGAYATSRNLGALEDKGVEILIPIQSSQPAPGHPAYREDPTTPVPPERWGDLPINRQSKRLDRKAFVYVEAEDAYYCPVGRKVEFVREKKQRREGGHVVCRLYECPDCSDCALAPQCKTAKAKARTIQRAENEALREAVAARVATPEGRDRYRRRLWIAETPFAQIKHVLGIRRFLLRGLDNVKGEWRWISTAYNLEKLIRKLTSLRARVAAARG